jgi:hypothetical protein
MRRRIADIVDENLGDNAQLQGIPLQLFWRTRPRRVELQIKILRSDN